MTRVKGTGPILEAKFDGKSKKSFTDLSGTQNLVLLSIKGNEYCTGDYLSAMINSSLVVHQLSTFLIADEIYWHNLKSIDVSSEDEAKLKSKATLLGTEFFDNHLKQFLAPLKINVDEFNQQYGDKNYVEKIQIINDLAIKKSLGYEVVCWSQWMKRAPYSYQDNQKELFQLYFSELSLIDAVNANAANYSKRHSQEANVNLLKFRSEGYLREESPGVVWLAAYLGYNFISYPGSMPKSFQATKDYFVTDSSQSINFVDDTSEKPLFIKSENRELLANLLEVNFLKTNKERCTSPVIIDGASGAVTPSLITEKSSENIPIVSSNPNQFFTAASNKNLVNMTLNILHSPEITTERCALLMAGVFSGNSAEKSSIGIQDYLDMVAIGLLKDNNTPMEKGSAFIRNFLIQFTLKSKENQKEIQKEELPPLITPILLMNHS